MPRPPSRSEFGAFLKQLRKRARLTQGALGLETGYGAAQICRFENGQRPPPDLPTLIGVFIPALGLADAPDDRERLLRLAAQSRNGPAGVGVDPAPRRAPQVQPPARVPEPSIEIIGREAESFACATLLRSGPDTIAATRLLSLIGPPGVGKTRLAVDIARRVRDDFPDGVFWVPLSPVSEPTLVGELLAATLRIARTATADAIDDVAAHLHQSRCLLVLDNLEHLLRDTSSLRQSLSNLLQHTSHMRVLVTTQTALNISGEQHFRIQPLAVPELARLPGVDALTANPAVQLFVRCARRQDPAFALTADTAMAVAAICGHLDGLPLAIELAAARTLLFAPAALLRMLIKDDKNRLRVLSQGARDAPERHRTLENAIGWSYGLLPPELQIAFARLSALADGFTADEARAVARVTPEQLEALVEHSLLSVDHTRGDESTFAMLSTLRAYASKILVNRGEEHETCRRHAVYMLGRARAITRMTRDLTSRAKMLSNEYPQFQQAVRWMVSNDPTRALRLLWTAGDEFWQVSGHVSEGRYWTEAALRATGDASPALRLPGIFMIGHLAMTQSDFPAARDWFTQGMAQAEATESLPAQFDFASALGWLHQITGASAEARGYFHRAYAIAQRIGNALTLAHGEIGMGVASALIDGDWDLSSDYYSRAAERFKAGGRYDSYAEVKFQAAGAHIMRGELDTFAAKLNELAAWSDYFPERVHAWYASARAELGVHAGQGDEALRQANAALALFRNVGNRQGECIALHHCARARRLLGELAEAARLHAHSLRSAMDIGNKNMYVRNIIGVALLACDKKQPATSARLLAAARTRLRELPPFMTKPAMDELDTCEALLSRQLGKTAFRNESRIGQRWSLMEACERAIGEASFAD